MNQKSLLKENKDTNSQIQKVFELALSIVRSKNNKLCDKFINLVKYEIGNYSEEMLSQVTEESEKLQTIGSYK